MRLRGPGRGAGGDRMVQQLAPGRRTVLAIPQTSRTPACMRASRAETCARPQLAAFCPCPARSAPWRPVAPGRRQPRCNCSRRRLLFRLLGQPAVAAQATREPHWAPVGMAARVRLRQRGQRLIQPARRLAGRHRRTCAAGCGARQLLRAPPGPQQHAAAHQPSTVRPRSTSTRMRRPSIFTPSMLLYASFMSALDSYVTNA